MRSYGLRVLCLAALSNGAACAMIDRTCDLMHTCPEEITDAGDDGSDGAGGTGNDAQAEATGAGGARIDASDGATDLDSSQGDALAEDSAPACNPDASPYAEPCSMTAGIFVSPLLGSNDNPGTQARPVATIAKALTLTNASKRVYVCSLAPDAARPGVDASDAGGPVDSAEAVKLASLPDGFHLWGGFDCSTWQHVSRPTRVKTEPGAIPLTIANTSTLTIEDFEFEASDGAAAAGGQSSIAAFVRNSTAVTLRGVSLRAGKGQAGAKGAGPAPNYSGNAPKGNGAQDTAGGAACLNNTCADWSTSAGGRGGSVLASDGGADAGGPEPGEDGTPKLGAGRGGESGVECSSGGSGRNGAPAPTAQDGEGARSYGSLSSTGWTPTDGNPGEMGGPGQGGGGGAAAITPDPGGGGGGGCGGCGGTGGLAGKGAGSSIALLSLDAVITLDECVLSAQEAGAGGDGSGGQEGQKGGNGGRQAENGGCPGGVGGNGGNGGAGGGGAGGLSVGIAFKGPQPTRTSATSEPTVFGTCAPGGNSSSTSDGGADSGASEAKGLDGVSRPELDLNDSTG